MGIAGSERSGSSIGDTHARTRVDYGAIATAEGQKHLLCCVDAQTAHPPTPACCHIRYIIISCAWSVPGLSFGLALLFFPDSGLWPFVPRKPHGTARLCDALPTGAMYGLGPCPELCTSVARAVCPVIVSQTGCDSCSSSSMTL